MRAIISVLMLIFSTYAFSQSKNYDYSLIYSAKRSQFMYIIDSIITNNSNPQAQKFAHNNKNFSCEISVLGNSSPSKYGLTQKVVNIKKISDYNLFVMCSYPYSSQYVLKYKDRYYGFSRFISELFLKKIGQNKMTSKIKFGGYWCFHIKDGVLHKYQFDSVGYDDAPDSVKYVINKECYIPLWDSK
ncbi:MAG: hypothetical protein IJE73_05120 [Muribaculaceae bacterium]|nr:hypothetical protein [Muribaculaceae bacterium]